MREDIAKSDECLKMRFREKEVLRAWSKSILSLTFLRAHWGGCFGVTATLLNSFAADPRRAENKERMLVSTIVSKNCYDTQIYIDAHSLSQAPSHPSSAFIFFYCCKWWKLGMWEPEKHYRYDYAPQPLLIIFIFPSSRLRCSLPDSESLCT